MDDLSATRVRAVLAQAAKLAGEARAAFLDRECEGDPALRAEVESLLAELDAADGFLESPPASLARLSDPRSLPGSGGFVEEEAGARIGPYRLVEVLGRGGMGTVWLAEQDEPIRRRVALKIVKAGMDSAAVIARFEAERQALALMDHPGVAQVFDASTTERGRPYFAMEYVPGLPITEYCDRERLVLKERLALLVQVCEAVQHAHQKGVIHRDLKPGNILVMLVDERPQPRIIDFGVAKAIRQRLTERSRVTLQGELIGTPEYMSPEQAGPMGRDVDTRSDVYSLGVVLYELLTGRLPFDWEKLRSGAWTETRWIMPALDPPRPSTRLRSLTAGSDRRSPAPPQENSGGGHQTGAGEADEIARARRSSPAALVRSLRGDLDWITMKALDNDRERRYATASDFAADLRRHLAHEPVTASPPSTVYRLRKFVRRRRGLVAAGLSVFVSLAAGLVSTSTLYFRSEREREHLLQARNESGRRLGRVHSAIGGRWALTLAQGDLANVVGTAKLRESMTLRALDEFAELHREENLDLDDYRAGMGYGHQALGEAQLVQGRSAEALVNHEKSLSFREDLVRSDPQESGQLPALGVGHWRRGEVLSVMGRLEEARNDYVKALEILEDALGRQTRVSHWDQHEGVYLGTAHRRIAEILALLGDSEGALAAYRSSMELVERGLRGEPGNPVLSRDRTLTLRGLGDAVLSVGRAGEAMEAFGDALALLERLAEKAGPVNVWERTHLARCLLSMAGAQASLGEWPEAVAGARRAVDLAQALSTADPDNFESRHLLGRGLACLGETQTGAGLGVEGLESCHRSIEVLETVSARDPDNALARRDLAVACRGMGRAHRALALLGPEEGLERSEHWTEARNSLARSVEGLARLQASGHLPPSDARLLEPIQVEIAECDAALAASGRPVEASGSR